MTDERERSDEDLARAAKRGDAHAFDVLVRRYLRRAMALAWQYVRSVEEAEDVVQDAFHRVVRSLGEYDDGRPFGAWFYAVVRNVARSTITRDARRSALAPLTLLEDEEPAAAAPAEPELAGDLERAIEALPPMQQASVRLCDVEGFTSVEAAHMLGVGEGTVRTHLHRARKRLRSTIDTRAGGMR